MATYGDIQSETDIKQIIADALLANLTPADKERLIQASLGVLLTVEKTAYGQSGSSKSRLQAAFDSACQRVAQDMALEMLRENTEFLAFMKACMLSATAQALVRKEEIRTAIVTTVVDRVRVMLDKEDW